MLHNVERVSQRLPAIPSRRASNAASKRQSYRFIADEHILSVLALEDRPCQIQ